MGNHDEHNDRICCLYLHSSSWYFPYQKRYQKTLKPMEQHIHIFVDCPQTVAPCDVERTFKSISAVEMFRTFPKLKKLYPGCGVLWSMGM